MRPEADGAESRESRSWAEELGKKAPSLRRLSRLWRQSRRGLGEQPWGVAGLKACARGCRSHKALAWLDRAGADWGVRDERGEGFEHWAAGAENACALGFWRAKGFSITRRDKDRQTAFEMAMASPGWGAELMLRIWPEELGAMEARSALYKAGKKAGAGLSATSFATAVGMVCRERPEAIAPDRRLSRRWEELFPGPMKTPKLMLEELENQSLARLEAEQIDLATRRPAQLIREGERGRARGRL